MPSHQTSSGRRALPVIEESLGTPTSAGHGRRALRDGRDDEPPADVRPEAVVEPDSVVSRAAVVEPEAPVGPEPVVAPAAVEPPAKGHGRRRADTAALPQLAQEQAEPGACDESTQQAASERPTRRSRREQQSGTEVTHNRHGSVAGHQAWTGTLLVMGLAGLAASLLAGSTGRP